MAETKPRRMVVYVELDPENFELLEKLKNMGLDKTKVVNFALQHLTEMSFEDFLKVMWIPEAKRLDVLSIFKGARKEGVKE